MSLAKTPPTPAQPPAATNPHATAQPPAPHQSAPPTHQAQPCATVCSPTHTGTHQHTIAKPVKWLGDKRTRNEFAGTIRSYPPCARACVRAYARGCRCRRQGSRIDRHCLNSRVRAAMGTVRHWRDTNPAISRDYYLSPRQVTRPATTRLARARVRASSRASRRADCLNSQRARSDLARPIAADVCCLQGFCVGWTDV